MKSTILALVIAATSVQACGAQSETATQCPTNNGAYYYSQGAWKSMDIAHSMGFKMTGLYSHSVKALFRDNSSPYQADGRELKFCLVGLIDSGRDLTLAKLSPTKKERELQFGKAGLSGFKMQIEDKDTVPLTVAKRGDKVYMISSKAPVPLGEYILLPVLPDMGTASNQATNISGYDVGVHSK